jgi:hypothetical protein
LFNFLSIPGEKKDENYLSTCNSDILTITSYFINADFSAAAPAPVMACWEQAFNKWSTCDGAYSNTRYLQATSSTYCASNSAATCSVTSSSYCSSQASTTCANNPNPSTCYNNAYNNCYTPQYQTCHTQTQADCVDNINTAYDNRGSDYGSCMGIEGNLGNCIEQMEDVCTDAINRAYSCATIYGDPEDADAYSACRAQAAG